MATALIYAVEDLATDGSPTLEIYRRPGLLDLDYATVKGWGIQATGQRPDFVWFRGDLYLVGGFTRVLVRHRLGTRWWPAGIRQPDAVISVVEGSGAGGSPGECLAYATFVHKVGERLMAESNPSNVIELTGQTGKGYDWTLQTSGAEERTTDVRCYRSMNGGPFRLAAEVPYGTGTFTENVKTNQLLQTGPSGHYLPPFGVSFAAKAFGRMWYARTNEYPHRLWGSIAGQPQYVPLTNYRDTEDREAITGLAKSRDVLIVFCLNATYILRKHGSGSFDFTLQKIDSAVGCTSHWAIREIHNKLWFPSTDGVWNYDGGLRYAMKDVREFWKEDYETNREVFKDAFAIDDRTGKNYMLFVPRPGKPAFTVGLANAQNIGTVAYVGNYLNFEPSVGGENAEPDWSVDLYNRLATCSVYSSIGEVLIGWDDANVRIFDEDDEDDDADTFGKELRVITGHQLFMEPGDDIEGGKTFQPIYVHMESEFNDWTANWLAGDERAAARLSVDNLNTWWKNDVLASERWGTVGTPPALAKFVPKTVHWMVAEKVVGRGLTAFFRAGNNRRMSYRGYGGWHLPGPAGRGPEVLGAAAGADYAVTPQYENQWTNLPVTKNELQGLTWNLRLDITGNNVGDVYILMRITKPSGAVEEFREKIADAAWTPPYQTAGQAVTLETGINTVEGFVVDGGEQSGDGSSTFTIEADQGIAGPTVYVECEGTPGTPEVGATVDLYVNRGAGLVFWEQKVTGVDGKVSWALIPSDTTQIRVDGSAGCGTDSSGPLSDWSAQINLVLAAG